MAKAKNKVAKPVLCRTLFAFTLEGKKYKPNTLLSVPSDLVDQLGDGVLDASDEAVEYCQAQGFEALEHVPCDEFIAAQVAECARLAELEEAAKAEKAAAAKAEEEAAKKAEESEEGAAE